MLDAVFRVLLKQDKDVIFDRLNKESIVKKHWTFMAISLLCLCFVPVFGGLAVLHEKNRVPQSAKAVDLEKKQALDVILLEFPHQSYKNISNWIFDAIVAAYAFDFNNFDNQVNAASYYFTDEGYRSYLTALTTSKVKKDILEKKLKVDLIPTQSPIMINGGSFGDTEFWRFRVPVLISYYGGKNPVFRKSTIELLILRVPAHKNPKGLAIAEFNIM